MLRLHSSVSFLQTVRNTLRLKFILNREYHLQTAKKGLYGCGIRLLFDANRSLHIVETILATTMGIAHGGLYHG
jgi:hypothetical protein